MDEAADQIKDLEAKKAENTQSEQQNENNFKNQDSKRSLWDNFKHTNICIMGELEREEREQGIENLCEKIMAQIFPNLVKEIHIQVQEAQRVPNKMNPKNPTPKIHSN